MITQKRLKELLHYDPATGIFTWLVSRTRVRKGDRAGSLQSSGYRCIGIDGKLYQESRIAFLYMEGYFPENDVDHINRKKDDNRWCNLRHVSRRCNMRNTGLQKNNKSGVKGVCWHRNKGKWAVQIKVNGKMIHLGCYESFDLAVRSRYYAEKKYNWKGCDSTSPAYLYLKDKGLI